MAHVLVTGGAGYIGSVLCAELLERGHKVTVLDRFFFGKDTLEGCLNNPNIRLIKDDIRGCPEKYFEGVDCVMDLAALSNDPACDLDQNIAMDINYRGCLHVAQTARRMGVKRYIFSSSCSVYGNTEEDVVNENSEPKPITTYAEAKVLLERDVLPMADENFCPVVLRNATAYGYSRRMRFDLVVNVMTLNAFNKNRIYILGGGQQWRPLVHIGDIARAFITVMEAPHEKVCGQIFNVGASDCNFKVFQVANMVRSVFPHCEVDTIQEDPDRRSYHVQFDKIASELDFRLTKTVFEGAVEVKQALERGRLTATLKNRTLDYYKYLLEAKKVLDEIMLDGKVF